MKNLLLIQPGARHNYALVRFLQQAGVLQALYTDFAVSERSVEHLLVQAGFQSGLPCKAPEPVAARDSGVAAIRPSPALPARYAAYAEAARRMKLKR